MGKGKEEDAGGDAWRGTALGSGECKEEMFVMAAIRCR